VPFLLIGEDNRSIVPNRYAHFHIHSKGWTGRGACHDHLRGKILTHEKKKENELKRDETAYERGEMHAITAALGWEREEIGRGKVSFNVMKNMGGP